MPPHGQLFPGLFYRESIEAASWDGFSNQLKLLLAGKGDEILCVNTYKLIEFTVAIAFFLQCAKNFLKGSRDISEIQTRAREFDLQEC